MGTSGDPWAPLGAYGGLWGPIGTFGDLWAPLGAHGAYGGLWAPFCLPLSLLTHFPHFPILVFKVFFTFVLPCFRLSKVVPQ